MYSSNPLVYVFSPRNVKIINIIYSTDGDCQSFYLCIGGDKYPTQTCPAGLYFDSTIGRCDWMGNVDCPSDHVEIPVFEELPEEIEHPNHSHEISDDVIQEIANEVAADLTDSIANQVAGMIDTILAEQLSNHEHTHHASSEITSSDMTSSVITSSDESYGELSYFQ